MTAHQLLVQGSAPALTLGSVSWQKGLRSQGNSNCVELGRVARGVIAMRDSKNPTGPALGFTDAEIGAMFADIQAGRWDEYYTH